MDKVGPKQNAVSFQPLHEVISTADAVSDLGPNKVFITGRQMSAFANAKVTLAPHHTVSTVAKGTDKTIAQFNQLRSKL